MANVKQGNLRPSPMWAAQWKHLRGWKRCFWKAERRAYKVALDRRPAEL